MKYRAIIFDLDGVLCHTDKYHFMAWQELADELGLPFSESVNDRMRGISRMESLDVLLEGSNRSFSPEEKRQLADKKNNRYRELLSALTTSDLAPGAQETLLALKAAGMLTAIGSSSQNTKLIHNRLGIEDFFDVVSDGTTISRSKPDPEVFLNAAALLTVDPAECLVVEDAKSGLLAAHAAGMDCAAMGDAKKYGISDYDLEMLPDLLKIVK